MIRYALINQKGGVCKTTSTINISSFLAGMGKRVLIIDMDPQGNVSTGIGFNKIIDDTIYNVLIDEWALEDVIYDTKIDNLYIVPSNIKLATAQLQLVSSMRREYKLLEGIEKSNLENYDYIFIDTPPSLDLLTINAITATERVLIPMTTDTFTVEGLTNLSKTIINTGQKLNPNIDIAGIFFSNVDSRRNIDDSIESINNATGGKLFNSIIHMYKIIEDAQAYGEPINMYDKNSKAAKEYLALVKELLKNESEKTA